jgi:prophage antirepressor-like protein
VTPTITQQQEITTAAPVKAFEFDGKRIRIVMGAEPLALASDVCRALGLPDRNGEIAYHLRVVEPEELTHVPRSTFNASLGGPPVPCVALSALPKLAVRSRDIDVTIRFLRWAGDELLADLARVAGLAVRSTPAIPHITSAPAVALH